MDRYYHINHKKISSGDFIEPGSMGNYINSYILYGYPEEHDLIWRLFQEQTFELVRLMYYCRKPSRLKSIFLFDSYEEVIAFISKDKREGAFIYEVEITDKNKEIHKASMKLYERIPYRRPVLPALVDQAHQYWKGINKIDPENEFWPEIIVESNVKVITSIEYKY